MKSQDLLPCPFCGGESEVVPDLDALLPDAVQCLYCDGYMPTVEAWNRRSPAVPSQHDGDQKLLEEIDSEIERVENGFRLATKWTALEALRDFKYRIEKRVQGPAATGSPKATGLASGGEHGIAAGDIKLGLPPVS